MSVKYRNQNGQETIIAGLTPGGELAYGTSTTRSGNFSITFDGSSASEGNVQVTFSEPMPDADYQVDFSYNGQWTGAALYANNKTANGFNVCYTNISSSTATRTYNYKAYKLYEIQHAQENAESIATLEAMVPSGAGAGNKLVTASQLTNTTNPIASDVANLKDLIPVGASISNQLVTKNEASVDSALSSTSEHAVQNKVVKAALDAKQNTLTFDNEPIAGSSNPVKSSGIYDTAADIYEVMGKNGAKNLIPYPYYHTTKTVNGVTFTDNGDGSITLNGTNTGNNTTFAFNVRDTKLFSKLKKMNTSFKLLGGVNSPLVYVLIDFYESSETFISSAINRSDTPTEFTIPSNAEYMLIFIRCGIDAVYSDLTIYPLLYLASDTDNTWQPYAKTNQQLTEDKAEQAEVNDIVNVLGAKNLLPYPWRGDKVGNGITYTVSDEVLSVDGTSTSNSYYRFRVYAETPFLSDGDYIMSVDLTGTYPTDTSLEVHTRTAPDASTSHSYDKYLGTGNHVELPFTINGDNYVLIQIFTGSGRTFTNATIKPMIRLASIADNTYVPYVKSNKELTENVKTLSDTTISVATLTDPTKFTGTVVAVKNGRNVTLASDVKIFANSIFTSNEVIASGLPLPIPSSQIATTVFSGILLIGSDSLRIRVSDNGELLIQAFTNGNSDIYGRITLSYIAKD